MDENSNIEKLEKLNYTKEYLQNQMLNDENFIINGDDTKIGNVDLKEIIDIDFSNNLKDELVIVHATDYSPSKSNAIVSPELTQKRIGELRYGLITHHRITVHSTINTLVANNNGGNWDYRMFTIIEPFSNIDSKVCGFGPADTFFLDKIELSKDGIVLVREEDKNKLTEEDKKMNIVFYKGNSRNAVYKAMILMGYKPQQLDINVLKNRNNTSLLEEFRKNNNYGPSLHSYTIYSKIEERMEYRDGEISRIRNLDYNINTCEYNQTNMDEVEVLLDIEKIYQDEEIDRLYNLLYLGIAFNDSGPYFLNTHQTLDRLSKYVDKENQQFKFNNKDDLKNNQELLKILEDFEKFKKMNNAYKQALYQNSILNTKMSLLSITEIQKNEYVANYIKELNQIFADNFNFRIQNNSFMINDIETSENIFKKQSYSTVDFDKQKLNNFDFTIGYINFDKNASLYDNIQKLSLEIYKLCDIMQKENILKLNDNQKQILEKIYSNAINYQESKFEQKASKIIEQMEQGIDVLGEHTDEMTNSNNKMMGFTMISLLGVITGIISIGIIILGIILSK